MNRTKIEWCDFTANPVRYRTAGGDSYLQSNGIVVNGSRVVWACEKLSAGCANCYAESLSRRYPQRRAGDWNATTMATLTPFLDEKELREILTSKKIHRKRVFIGDMTDIFGEWVSDELLDRLFGAIALREDVTFQILTKRADRMQEYFADPDRLDLVQEQLFTMHSDYTTNAIAMGNWPLKNVWLGVSAESQEAASERVPWLLDTLAAVRFVSYEPAIGPIDFRRYLPVQGLKDLLASFPKAAFPLPDHLTPQPRIDWIIVGGESGPKARPFDVMWAHSAVEQCAAAGVAVFVKQLGAVPMMTDARWRALDRVPMLAARNIKRVPADFVPLALDDRKGGDMSAWPESLRVRQFPQAVR